MKLTLNKSREKFSQLQISYLISVIYLIAFNLPWQPETFINYDLDSSWVAVLHGAFSKKMQWGKDIVWHYGPLGFLYGKFYFKTTYKLMFTGWVLINAIFIYGLWRLREIFTESPLAPLLLSILISLTEEGIFIAFTLMFITEHYFINRKNYWFKFGLIVAMAVISHIKATYLFASIISIFCAEIHSLQSKKYTGVMSLCYVLVFLLVWKILGQKFINIIPYLRGMTELVSGFSMLSTFNRPITHFIAYLAFSFTWLYHLNDVYQRKFVGYKSLPIMISYYALIILALKIGFIQSSDHHFNKSIIILLLIVAFTKHTIWQEVTKLGKISLAITFIMFAPLFVSNVKIPQLKIPQPNHSQIKQKSEFSSYNSDLLPVIKGSYDLINYSQIAPIQQYGFENYLPRPVFQSYHAYTPYLQNLNCQAFTQRKSADNLFLALQPMVGSYPNIIEGPCLPMIIANYRMKGIYNEFLHLEKLPKAKDYSITYLSTINASLNQNIPLPKHNNPLWIKINLNTTLLGKLAEKLLTSIPLYIEYELLSGYQRTDRLFYKNLNQGFIVSPLINTSLNFAQLMGGDIKHNRLKSFKITTKQTLLKWLLFAFREKIIIDLYNYNYSAGKNNLFDQNPELKAIAELTSDMSFSETGSSKDITDQHLELMRYKDNYAIKIRGEAVLNLQPKKNVISFNYGNIKAFDYFNQATGEVEFSVEAISKKKSQSLVWQDTMPALANNLSSERHVEIKVPADTKKLKFYVKPKIAHPNNWSFIGNIKYQ